MFDLLLTKRIGLVFCALLVIGQLAAQESPSPSPSPPARNIRVSFVPPPLDGTISLGIYDAKGKLVRVLFREADINEFTIGSDALSTTWDGKDDAGDNVPPGKYSAHGFVVGELKIEGIGFFFNDWISSAEAPRFSRIRSLAMHDEKLLLAVDLVPPAAGHVLYDVANKTVQLKDTDADAKTPAPPAASASDIDPIATIPGRENSRWVIDRTEKGGSTIEVKQFSAKGDFLRRLPVSPNEPQPKAIAASLAEDRIYLLEEDSARQRVRGLSLAATKTEGSEKAVSEWKVDFEKSIVVHPEFSVVDGKVAPASQGTTPDKVKIKLQANPLLNDDRVTVEISVGYDADGSFLKSADGLPLCTISETQELRRALLWLHDTNALDVFQDDGAVVEQFRVTGIDQMMSFDCGGFELK
ncbi:MAG: hypothetical protein DME97_11195 [Verrucomicrobia bacterium]|nr:MAG: hypothetical protein DME97_11195 [Verrucomicrobiota bacterium]